MNKADKAVVEAITGEKQKDTPVSLDLFDFSTRERASVGVDFAIPDPRTGIPSATVFTLLGLDSDEYLAFKEAEDKEAAELAFNAAATVQRGEKFVMPANTKSDTDKIIERLVALTKGWKNVRWNGEDLPFTRENARKVYSENAIVRSAVRRFIEDRTHFFQNAQTN